MLDTSTKTEIAKPTMAMMLLNSLRIAQYWVLPRVSMSCKPPDANGIRLLDDCSPGPAVLTLARAATTAAAPGAHTVQRCSFFLGRMLRVGALGTHKERSSMFLYR